jgi:hypothetical protein
MNKKSYYPTGKTFKYIMLKNNEQLEEKIKNPRARVDHLQNPVYMTKRAASVGRNRTFNPLQQREIELNNVNLLNKIFTIMRERKSSNERGPNTSALDISKDHSRLGIGSEQYFFLIFLRFL